MGKRVAQDVLDYDRWTLNIDAILGRSDAVAPDDGVTRSLDANCGTEGTGDTGEGHAIVLNAASGSDRDSRCARSGDHIGLNCDIRHQRVGSAAELNPTIAARQNPVLDTNER
jgi:hypothetical protein